LGDNISLADPPVGAAAGLLPLHASFEEFVHPLCNATMSRMASLALEPWTLSIPLPRRTS